MTSQSSSDSGRPPFRAAPALPSPDEPAGAAADVPPARWAGILADLADRGVPTDSVRVVSARAVTWTDGSLGCPKAGRSYTQALVPGMRVIVRVGDQQFDYRFGRTDAPRLCGR